jgi:adenine-specific DNA-methyltransferase
LYSGKEITTLRGDLWKDFYKDMGNVKKEGSANLTNGKKPERLISDIISAFTSEGDIVLDAYLGSGTTAAVAHKMGRRYIGIEQLDSHSAMEIERMQSVIAGEQTGISKSVNWTGGGSFVFMELAKNSQNVLDRITATNDADELSAIYDEVKSSPFVLYTVDILKMEKEKDAFAALTIDEQKKFLVSIIDKNTLYVNYSDIENDNHSLSDADKAFTKNFYKED